MWIKLFVNGCSAEDDIQHLLFHWYKSYDESMETILPNIRIFYVAKPKGLKEWAWTVTIVLHYCTAGKIVQQKKEYQFYVYY